MDISLSEEQQAWQEVLRRFVDERIKPVARDLEHSGDYPHAIVNQMKELGLFGLTVPESYGGLGSGAVGLAVTFEEIARGWMSIAGTIGSHSLACKMIADHGTSDQKDRYLAELATGQRRTAIALTEPGAGSDLQGIRTRARRDGDSYVLNGTKMWITNARFANPLPVLARLDDLSSPRHRNQSVFLVEAGTPGLTVSRDLGKLGYKGIDTCEVVLEDVRVPAENLLGGVEGQGLKHVLSALEIGRVNVAARSIGIAQAAYDMAIEYAQQREAFGEPIANFQAIQMKLTKMATDIQASRLLTWWAASRIDSGKRADVEAGMAKLFASETAMYASQESMRIHGAYGFSTEYEVERLYRDAPLMVIGEGTNEILSQVIAKGLLARSKSAGVK